MSSPLTVIYEFDRFRLDRQNQRLTRDGLLIGTPGKTLPLLLTLIEHRDQMVTIEKLVETFYPKSSFAEEELTTELLKLKRLLDDSSKQAPIIRFVLGKGYQFEAEVTEYLGDSTNDAQFGSKEPEEEPEREQARARTKSQSHSKSQSRSKSYGATLGVVAGVILLAALGFAVWHFMPTKFGAAASKGSPQVAVLPFQSLTGAAGDDHFNQSLTEAIINTLGKNSQLQVVPEASVQHYVESGAADPVTAGRELGAQMIVRGMAQRLAGHILVKVQLLSAEDGSQIWSSGFEGDSNDIAGLSARISEKIGKGVPGVADGERQ